MWRGARLTVRRVVVSLLMLATLLIYAAPSHASLLPHHQSSAPHEHVLTTDHDGRVTAVLDHEHDGAPCEDSGLLDGSACCSVAQCATMHGGVLTAAVGAFVPYDDVSPVLPTLATPDGVGIDPALRPPR